ncbi:MAG: hypothetical protein HC881_16010 [Leptolyngbyaceae cyanobacterium SL_7_1]|nr:hypothetical protein [Leptolyngbyaceae cyanobacterium SL_7_1]
MTMELRTVETDHILSALDNHQSLLVLGEPGSGRTTLGYRVLDELRGQGYAVALVSYSGSAKECLVRSPNNSTCPRSAMTTDPGR